MNKIEELRKLLDEHPENWSKSPCTCGHRSCHSWFLNFTGSDGRVEESEADLVVGMKDALPDLLDTVELLNDAAHAINKAFEFDDGDVFGMMHNQVQDTISAIKVILEKLK